MAKEPIYIETYKMLKKQILNGEYKNGDILPTEEELSKKYFISRITVRKTLGLLQKDGLIVRSAGRGTFVDMTQYNKKTAKKVIGVVLCNLGGSFGANLLTAIEAEIAKLGYLMAFKNSRDDIATEKEAIDELLSMGVAGIIIQPIHNLLYNEKIIRLHLKGFPLVLIDRHHYGFKLANVSTDNRKAALEITDYLFSCGHKKVVFASIDTNYSTSISDRFKGFRDAFIENELLFTRHNYITELKSPIGHSSPEEKEIDIQIIMDFLNNHPETTCFLACEFAVTRLITAAMKRLGKKLLADYSLAMFDTADNIYGRIPCHIEQDQFEMGLRAVNILNDVIGGCANVSSQNFVAHRLIKGSTVKNLLK